MRHNTPGRTYHTHRFIHAQRTVIIVSRNLERTNQNDGFRMTALERQIKCLPGVDVFSVHELGQMLLGTKNILTKTDLIYHAA